MLSDFAAVITRALARPPAREIRFRIPRVGAKYNYDDAPAGLVAQALRLDAICRAHDVPLKAAAIQFPFTHPAVGAVLTGARSDAELRENVAMFETPIAPELWNALRAG